MKKLLLVFLIYLGGCTTEQPIVEPIPNNYSVAKTALVIGNSNYENASLKNPVNDADDMAASLRNLGFNVILEKDLDSNGMKNAINEFKERLLQTKEPDIGIFYYSGHGTQVKNENFLIPIDNKKITNTEILKQHAIFVSDVSEMMKVANTGGTNVITLDSCRDNPYKSLTRSSSKGLAKEKFSAPKSSTIVAFATAPGETASDNGPDGRHGVYTYYLLDVLNNVINNKTTRIDQVFEQVRDIVYNKTEQEPFFNASLRVYCDFKGKCSIP